jgi:hypothetical protein
MLLESMIPYFYLWKGRWMPYQQWQARILIPKQAAVFTEKFDHLTQRILKQAGRCGQ